MAMAAEWMQAVWKEGKRVSGGLIERRELLLTAQAGREVATGHSAVLSFMS
jgi:hypothetical protein